MKMKPGLEFPICCQTGLSQLAALWLILHTFTVLQRKTGSGGASEAAGDSEKEAPWPVRAWSSPAGHRRSPKTQSPKRSETTVAHSAFAAIPSSALQL